MSRIAFIGLGNMGGPMAANLVKNGHSVRVFDLVPAAVQAAVDAGASAASSARDTLADAEVVISMLPASRHVEGVYLGDDGILAAIPAGALVIDCSTIAPASARKVSEAAAARGLQMIDAPVSGGTVGAAAGTLTFMVGGGADTFAKATPLFEVMGQKAVHCGGAGAGQAAKLCNNMILGATMIATCEGFALAERLGLDPQVFYDISSKATGQSWSMTSYCPVPGVGPQTPADNDYQGGFATALMLKDLKLAMEAAETAGLDPQIGRRAKELYENFDAAGNGGLDFSGPVTNM